jgi:ribosomal protein S18 acetylase RimI-like enzyme
MSGDNLERMIRLADEFFDMKNDPDQISVNEQTMELLRKLHPATLNEKADSDGPIAWILVIPTTHDVMEKFVEGSINERELLTRTPLGEQYDAVYLCSALVLPEFRGSGLARTLTIEAVKSIQRDHPIRHLFYWAFSIEGEKLGSSVARELGLPLLLRSSS